MIKRSTPPQMPCSCCKGVGTVPLSRPLWIVYQDILKHPGTTTKAIHRRHKGKVHQFYSNKVGLLREMKLLTRSKINGKWQYTAINPNTK